MCICHAINQVINISTSLNKCTNYEIITAIYLIQKGGCAFMIKNKAINLYRQTNIYRTFMKKNLKSSVNKGISKKINFSRKGFLSESAIIYNFTKNDPKEYLSDIQRLNTRYLNSPYSFILDEKLVFESMYKQHITIPKNFSLIEKGKFLCLENEEKIDSALKILNYLDKHNACVIKPIRNGGGYGIFVLKKIKEEYYLNEKQVDEKELEKVISKLHNYVVNEFVGQSNFSKEFYPKTTNTIRILTMIDPVTNKPFIPIAVQRMGNLTSIPADNWTQGGLSAEIDLNSGELGEGVTYPKNGKLEWYSEHPETKSKIMGKIVPYWHEIKESILNAASLYPYIKYVGWDIVITDDGFSVLEGNNFSDVNLLQVHRPLLSDERVSKFYKYHGII